MPFSKALDSPLIRIQPRPRSAPLPRRGPAGRLARAFEMGYYAESLEELERTCFVPRHRRG